VALVTHHEKGKHCVICSTVVCQAAPYFSTLSYTRNYFRKNVI